MYIYIKLLLFIYVPIMIWFENDRIQVVNYACSFCNN